MILEKEIEMKRYTIELEDKVGKLEFRNIALEKELKEYKRNCDVMKERVTRVEEYHQVMFERERRAKQRIDVLSEELEMMERERTEFKVQWKTEVRDLECGKRRAEEEVEVWKKKFGELETRISLLEEEATFLRCIEDHFCGKLPYESGGLPDELSNEAQVKKDQNKASTSMRGGNSGFYGAGMRQLQINENLLNTNGNVHTSDIAGFNTLSPVKESRGKKIAGIIDISDTDTEDERNIAPNHASNLRDGGMVDKEKEVSSKKCLKRLYADQNLDENRSICEENPVTSTPKRRRAKIVTSESESEDDDKIPISNLKMKKPGNLEDIAHRPSRFPMKLRSQTLASRSEKVEESPSRKRLLSLKQCEEKKNSRAEKKCPNDTTYPNDLNRSDQKAGSAPVENYNEKVVLKEDSSDSEGESLGGFIVNGSDSSDSSTDSKEEGDTDLRYNQVIAALRRKTDKKSKWQFEADMLSSFEEDPELCMKAVCALYRQQTSEEKSVKGCLTYNGRGFSRFDAPRGSDLAEFLMDGEKDGDLKKSVEELETHDSWGLEDCKRLARHYSKQLFTIYRSKEDPFFV